MKPIYYYSISAIIFSIGLFFYFRNKKNKKRLQDLDYSSESRNIALSITNCKALHKELAKMIHPDKFNEDKREHADKLMQNINSAKYDYNKLNILKSEVQDFLNKKL